MIGETNSGQKGIVLIDGEMIRKDVKYQKENERRVEQ